eukprot:409189_1
MSKYGYDFSQYNIDNIRLNESTVNAIDLTVCPSINIINHVSASIQRRLAVPIEDVKNPCIGMSAMCAVGVASAVTCCILTLALGCPACIGLFVGGPCSSAAGQCVAYGVAEALKPACFGGSNMLLINRNGFISELQLDEIQINDYVLSKDRWSKIWFINRHYGEYNMIDLYYNDKCNFNDSYGSNSMHITLSRDHLLYVNGAGWMMGI